MSDDLDDFQCRASIKSCVPKRHSTTATASISKATRTSTGNMSGLASQSIPSLCRGSKTPPPVMSPKPHSHILSVPQTVSGIVSTNTKNTTVTTTGQLATATRGASLPVLADAVGTLEEIESFKATQAFLVNNNSWDVMDMGPVDPPNSPIQCKAQTSSAKGNVPKDQPEGGPKVAQSAASQLSRANLVKWMPTMMVRHVMMTSDLTPVAPTYSYSSNSQGHYLQRPY